MLVLKLSYQQTLRVVKIFICGIFFGIAFGHLEPSPTLMFIYVFGVKFFGRQKVTPNGGEFSTGRIPPKSQKPGVGFFGVICPDCMMNQIFAWDKEGCKSAVPGIHFKSACFFRSLSGPSETGIHPNSLKGASWPWKQNEII